MAYIFALAASPGFALVGERTRWWLIFPAAAGYAVLGQSNVFRVWTRLEIASLIYAAVLLFATRKISRLRREFVDGDTVLESEPQQ
jgi:hypothetical protein